MSDKDLENEDENEDESGLGAITSELSIIAFSTTAQAFIHKEEQRSSRDPSKILRDKSGNIIYKMKYDAERHRIFHRNLLVNYDVLISEMEKEEEENSKGIAGQMTDEELQNLIDADFEESKHSDSLLSPEVSEESKGSEASEGSEN